MVANNGSSSSANGSNGGGHRPAAAAKRAPTPSTWTVFLFHFALPMALVAILSNINDIYSGLVSFPSHLLHHAGNTAKTMQPKLSTESSVKMPTLSPKERPTAAVNNQQHPQTQTTATTTTTTTRPTVATTKSSTTTTTTQSSKTSTSSTSSNHPRHRQNAASDPFHQQMETNIRTLRHQYKQAVNTPNEHLAAIQLADFLKYRDTVIHDGGTYQMEAIEVYSRAVSLLEDKWRNMMTNGEDTRKTATAHNNEDHDDQENDYYSTGLNHELFLDYGSKSIEGLLCATYTNLGKTYFMSNMFERAVQSHNQCLSYDHRYIDALSSRGQAYIILGKYKEAATDFFQVLYMDSNRLFGNVVTGLARCLSADDNVIDGGWESLVQLLEADIPRQVESLQRAKELSDDSAAATIKHYADILKHMHHAMFQYHDIKTKNVAEAWKHLSKGNEYKMSTLAPFDEAFELDKVSRLTNVFTPGFWPAGMGSDTKTPIFIIGFVRSGSTLLERILDAHPLIVGTGEDSVFNGRLDSIRNDIIKASMAGQGEFLQTVKKLADDVVVDMIKRWEIIDANTNSEEDLSSERVQNPTRFVDKMLSNYMNVGFIHLLFPNALILHVAREPMDSIFSAFKHDFPPGGFDYTSEFSSLARLYHGYRDVMEHWDKVLPGRVTHIRYEDLVKDLPGMAPKILEKAGVPWDPAVLEFHQKKHAVNTLSTTQVRKGVYSHHLKGWKRYEEFLEPLLKRIGSRVEFKLSTSLTPSTS